jgi:hypothetical protein
MQSANALTHPFSTAVRMFISDEWCRYASSFHHQSCLNRFRYHFVKGHLLVRQFVHKAGCIQLLFLVPIVKNIQFLLCHELQIGIMRTAQKTVGAVKIYYTNEKTLLQVVSGDT